MAISYGRGRDADAAVAVVRRIYEAFARRDIDAVLALADPGGEWHLSGTAAALGRQEPFRGHGGLREYFAEVDAVWDDLHIDPADIRATAGGVVVFGEIRAVIEGAPVHRRVAWVWQVRDGCATSVRVSDIADLPAD